MYGALRLGSVAVILSFSVACNAGPVPWYFGSYKIARAEPAPWNDATFKPDAAEVATYAGKTVSIGKAIHGPALLGCAHPVYVLKNVEAAYLFEGGLAVGAKPEAAADAAAVKLGFKKGEIEALETGCESEIAYMFRDHDHAAFALDNMIYWLERQ